MPDAGASRVGSIYRDAGRTATGNDRALPAFGLFGLFSLFGVRSEPTVTESPLSTLRSMATQARRTSLRLDEGGLWAIKSTSASVIYLDLDKKLLWRMRGPGSPAWEYDSRWVPLVAVEDISGRVDAVTVGTRHLYLTDPDGGSCPYQWWAPRACTSIESARPEDLPLLS